MSWLRRARLVATLLLAFQAYAVARASAPQHLACHCGAHCACASHLAKAKGPCLRVGCEMPPPVLTLTFFLHVPRLTVQGWSPDGRALTWGEARGQEAPDLPRERPPPRGSA